MKRQSLRFNNVKGLLEADRADLRIRFGIIVASTESINEMGRHAAKVLREDKASDDEIRQAREELALAGRLARDYEYAKQCALYAQDTSPQEDTLDPYGWGRPLGMVVTEASGQPLRYITERRLGPVPCSLCGCHQQLANMVVHRAKWAVCPDCYDAVETTMESNGLKLTPNGLRDYVKLHAVPPLYPQPETLPVAAEYGSRWPDKLAGAVRRTLPDDGTAGRYGDAIHDKACKALGQRELASIATKTATTGRGRRKQP